MMTIVCYVLSAMILVTGLFIGGFVAEYVGRAMEWLFEHIHIPKLEEIVGVVVAILLIGCVAVALHDICEKVVHPFLMAHGW